MKQYDRGSKRRSKFKPDRVKRKSNAKVLSSILSTNQVKSICNKEIDEKKKLFVFDKDESFGDLLLKYEDEITISQLESVSRPDGNKELTFISREFQKTEHDSNKSGKERQVHKGRRSASKNTIRNIQV